MCTINPVRQFYKSFENAVTQDGLISVLRYGFKEPVFGFNKRILAYFACDLCDVYMTTRLEGPMTNFLPFNQGSNGAGRDGGAGNPPNPTGGYVTSYFWENVLQKDKLMDILQKFISYEKTEKKEVMPDGSTNIKKTGKTARSKRKAQECEGGHHGKQRVAKHYMI